ncbi:histidine kinase [Leptospira semungkisensis]|uniref:histidine kinase n=1 Tax=Leptospira semungkisensis TaxID=2484985 RepID=A0A4R9G6K2_9LEPT|nr:sensor histidine kinase [Leptospira semungkisensis]TGK06825.1 histidine kinase [Leptospira semungkisensis]
MLSYNAKLRIGFIGAGVLALIIGLSSWVSSRNLAESKDWESHTFGILSKLERLSAAIRESEISLLSYLSTRQKIHVQNYENSKLVAIDAWNELKEQTRDNPEQQLTLDKINESFLKRDRLIHEIMLQQGDVVRIKALIVPIAEDIKRLAEELKQRENELLVVRSSDSKVKMLVAEWILAMSFLFNILVLIVLYRFLNNEYGLRVRTERDFFEKNTLLGLIMENMADGVVVLDRSGSRILLNDKSERLLATSADLLTLLDNLEAKQGKVILKEGTPEEQIILANGTALNDAEGKNLGKVFLLSDITLEEQISNEKEAYMREMLMIKTALDCVSSNIMIADNDLNVVYTNKSVINMFQTAKENIRSEYPSFSPEAILGSCIDGYHSHPEKQRGVLSTFNSTYKSSISIGGREFNLSADPVINEKGERLGSVVEWLDVTERNRKESQINQLNRELEENVKKLEYANRELEAFSYSVSHDLRAPIRGVDGFARIMLEDFSSKMDPEAVRLLNIIASNSKFMGQLIDDLLAFYRVSKVEPKSDRVDMKHMVLDAIEIINQEYQYEKVNTRISDLPIIRGDGSMLKQVWLNLISNAFKYSSKSENPIVEIGYLSGESDKTFFVKDNGVGFNNQYTHKLFKVFQRLHSNEEFHGTGIGLAIVDRIVKRHGGEVRAEGKIGEGATFYFTIPNKE